MKGLFDYHTHSPWCRHAEGRTEDYVLEAKKKGLAQIGLSDHLPWPKDEHKSWTMLRAELPNYVEEVRALQKAHPDIEILLAAEADYHAETLGQVGDLLSGHDFDYVIGSVHVLGKWGMDNHDEIAEWGKRDIDGIWRDYFRALRESAESGLFDIIGHCDVAKKFNFLPKADMTGEMRKTAEAFAKAGVLAEINTSGLRKPCREIYPSEKFLRILNEAGVGITLGSDAHRPQDVGADFGLALRLARDAGFSKWSRYSRLGFLPEALPSA